MTEGEIWNLVVTTGAVLVVALLGIANARWAANKAGQNSDKALVQTIKADREARILERRFELYGDILTFVAKRRQNRNVATSAVTVEGIKQMDPYVPEDVFGIMGRTQALADKSVLDAFVEADEASMSVVRSYNWTQIAKDDPNIVKNYERLIAHKQAADVADTNLERVIRAALHSEPITGLPVDPEATETPEPSTGAAPAGTAP